jgi:hypothetical protein
VTKTIYLNLQSSGGSTMRLSFIQVFLFCQFVCLGMMGSVPSAYARLVCSSEWITDELGPHCHVRIAQKEAGDSTLVCIEALPASSTGYRDELNTRLRCEQSCKVRGVARQKSLERLLLKQISHESHAASSAESALVLAKKLIEVSYVRAGRKQNAALSGLKLSILESLSKDLSE